MISVLTGITQLVNEEQYWKACCPIIVTLSGIVISLNDLQWLNVLSSIVWMPSGIAKCFNASIGTF